MRFGVDEVRPAVLGIDLHRGHLDPEIATMPLSAEAAAEVVAANERFFEESRARGIPVVHLVQACRDSVEVAANPFWRSRAEDPASTRTNVLRHNLAGSPGCTIMPALLDEERDLVIETKKRYDAFRATDLDLLLRSRGINTVLITGVNTNSCVLSTTTAACALDYAPIVVEDCVDTIDGPELHAASLTCIRAAFGWTTPSDEVWKKLEEAA